MNFKLTKVHKSKFDLLESRKQNFGSNFSDYMFIAKFSGNIWHEPEIKPFENLSFSPATSVFHYAQTIFEGMKAFFNEKKDGINIFRSKDNYLRFAYSSERMAIPILPEEYFREGIEELIKIERNWVPRKENESFYIRPFAFATEEFIGVRPAKEFYFIIIGCPVGQYYSKDISVKIENKYSRACLGGTGMTKCGGNYAGSLYPDQLAQKEGFDQVIWTDSNEHKYIEEVGTMNVAFEIDGEICSPKSNGTILNSITKDSFLTLAREKGISINESPISVQYLIDKYKEGAVTDAFGLGTAAIVSHIKVIHHKDITMDFSKYDRTQSKLLRETLLNIQYGKIEDTHNWITTV